MCIPSSKKSIIYLLSLLFIITTFHCHGQQMKQTALRDTNRFIRPMDNLGSIINATTLQIDSIRNIMVRYRKATTDIMRDSSIREELRGQLIRELASKRRISILNVLEPEQQQKFKAFMSSLPKPKSIKVRRDSIKGVVSKNLSVPLSGGKFITVGMKQNN